MSNLDALYVGLYDSLKRTGSEESFVWSYDYWRLRMCLIHYKVPGYKSYLFVYSALVVLFVFDSLTRIGHKNHLYVNMTAVRAGLDIIFLCSPPTGAKFTSRSAFSLAIMLLLRNFIWLKLLHTKMYLNWFAGQFFACLKGIFLQPY